MKRREKKKSNLKYSLDSKWRTAVVQQDRNLAQLCVMTLKAMWWYTNRSQTILLYERIHFQVAPFLVHEIYSL